MRNPDSIRDCRRKAKEREYCDRGGASVKNCGQERKGKSGGAKKGNLGKPVWGLRGNRREEGEGARRKGEGEAQVRLVKEDRDKEVPSGSRRRKKSWHKHKYPKYRETVKKIGRAGEGQVPPSRRSQRVLVKK